MNYQTLKVEQLQEATIIRVSLYRPKTLNAVNMVLLQQIQQLFQKLNTHPTARVVILQGDGKLFCSGLDLKQMGSIFALQNNQDTARNAAWLYKAIQQMQKPLVNIYKCRLPVIIGTHKLCIGAGVDIIAPGDIRYCTKDCIFAIKEIDLGLAADLGSLQFFPRFTGNSSTFRELAYTGRNFGSAQALRVGFVTKIFETKEELDAGLLETAKSIASKSPVGIYTIKSVIQHGERDIHDNLQYVRRTNSVMLQTKDTIEAFSAYLQKRPPVFSKL